jgi:spermidine synthase
MNIGATRGTLFLVRRLLWRRPLASRFAPSETVLTRPEEASLHPRIGLRLLELALFLSGAAGLIYEVVWTRQLADVMGSTALAMTSVFSAFMLALALGALVIGRTPKRGGQALALYGQLEIAIGVTALGTSFALVRAPSWLAVHLPDSSHFGLDLALKLLFTLALLGVPVFLMGGTLPAVLNAVERWAPPRQVVARLYGLNTLGAACGTLAAGFVLIWALGLTRTLGLAIGLNLLVGLAASVAGELAGPAHARTPEALVQGPSRQALRGERALWLALAFLSGFAIFGYEMLWGRIAKFLLGDRTIAISALLFVFISGLGLASLLASRVIRRSAREGPGDALAMVAWAMLVGGLLHLVAVPLASATAGGGGLAHAFPLGSEFAERVAIIWVLVFPPILVLGLSFPLLVAGARELDLFPGRALGHLLFVNTLGAALGAAVATYLLSRWLGTLGGFLLLTALLVAASAMALWGAAGGWRRPLAALAVALVIVAAFRFPTSLVLLRKGEILGDSAEDEYGVQVLALTSSGTARVRNNRLQLIYDLGNRWTSHAQQMAAHMTVLLARQCRDVINIGTGYGITAGTFTRYADVRSIETVEILPFLAARQPVFARYNFAYWSDPRVTFHQDDGRHVLLTSGRAYDIVSINVLDPYLPGSSSLFTTDFYRAVKQRLRPGGVMTQLLWGSDVNLLIRGLQTVFPALLFFPTYSGSSYNVVAFRDPVDPERVPLHLERLTPAARQAIRSISAVDDAPDDPELYLVRLVDAARKESPLLIRRAMREAGPLHTDDRPVLEYRWAHGIPEVSVLDSPLVDQ